MELRVLRYFLAVADHGSVTAAADRVHVAQPAISRQLRALEAELGVPLFVRHGRNLRLGPAGRRFLPIARDLVTRADGAAAAMTALAHGLHVRLVVAAHPTTIADVIAPFVASRGGTAPPPSFVSAAADHAYHLLARAEVDVAISTNPPPTGTASELIAEFPIWAQLPPTHAWATLPSVPLELLLREPLILLDPSFGARRVFDAELERLGSSCEISEEVAVSEIAQALAAGGRGVAVLTDDPAYGLHALEIGTPSGRLRIRLHAAWNPTHYAAGSIRDFVASLAAYCAAATQGA